MGCHSFYSGIRPYQLVLRSLLVERHLCDLHVGAKHLVLQEVLHLSKLAQAALERLGDAVLRRVGLQRPELRADG
jgi:hypothetical protein